MCTTKTDVINSSTCISQNKNYDNNQMLSQLKAKYVEMDNLKKQDTENVKFCIAEKVAKKIIQSAFYCNFNEQITI